jgi:hypothetical protein
MGMRLAACCLAAAPLLLILAPAAPPATTAATRGAAPGARAEFRITGETKVAPYRFVKLEATGAADKSGFLWDVTPKANVDRWVQKDRLVFVAPPGLYSVRCTAMRLAADGETLIDEASVDVTIGDAPTPTPPTPPVPPTPPTPPTPPPTPPGPAPIAGEGVKVLIVEDVRDRIKLPATQLAILFDKGVRDYLGAKCVAGPDGKTKEWRILDAKTDTALESKTWQDALRRPRTGTPWLVVSNPKGRSYEGPLPADADKTLELLKRHIEGAGAGAGMKAARAKKKGGR